MEQMMLECSKTLFIDDCRGLYYSIYCGLSESIFRKSDLRACVQEENLPPHFFHLHHPLIPALARAAGQPNKYFWKAIFVQFVFTKNDVVLKIETYNDVNNRDIA